MGDPSRAVSQQTPEPPPVLAKENTVRQRVGGDHRTESNDNPAKIGSRMECVGYPISTLSTESKIISDLEALTLSALYRDQKRCVVLTNGVFDLLTVGHCRCLQEARSCGDVLFVAVNNDQSVRDIKGSGRPVRPEQDRALVLSALACVDHIVLFPERTPLRLIQLVRPKVLVKGGDYLPDDQIPGRPEVESWGGRLHLAKRVNCPSTTQTIQQLEPT